MNIVESFAVSYDALLSNKLRSGLTMLGVIIGVFSVIIMVSLGQGAKEYINKQFTDMGTNMLIIQPGKSETRGHWPPPGGSQHKLTLADAEAVKKRAPSIQALFPLVIGSGLLKYREKSKNTTVVGTNEEFPSVVTVSVEIGSFLSESDSSAGRRVCVLGYSVAKDIFDVENPLGRFVRINSSDYRVIGVTRKKGQGLGFDFDEWVYIPAVSAQKLFNLDRLFGIRAKARSAEEVDAAVRQTASILKKRHNNTEDFTIQTQADMLSTLNTILTMLTTVLGGIAGISLLVGGIGIMNIMLVSVRERTREIGIRKAVGARKKDILLQFLIESVTLSSTGGIVGIVLGMLAYLLAASFIEDFPTIITGWSIPLGFFFSAVVGVFFGVYPAKRAADLDPIDALRYE